MTRCTIELEPEVRGWLEGLSTTHFAAAAFYVDLLAAEGPLLGEPYTRQLDGKLRELRVPSGRPGRPADLLDRDRLPGHPADRLPEDPHA
jgi:hypothetical protein